MRWIRNCIMSFEAKWTWVCVILFIVLDLISWNVFACRRCEMRYNDDWVWCRMSDMNLPCWQSKYTTEHSQVGCAGDLVPKGVQEKRTEVLENKVDRMWVSNAFFEWTHVKSSTSEGRRQCCSSFLRNLTQFQCDLWQYVEHYTLQQAHITVLLIMQLTAKTQLILQEVIHMSITKWTVVVLGHTEQHATMICCNR